MVTLRYASVSGFNGGRQAVYNTLEEAIAQGEADYGTNSDLWPVAVLEWEPSVTELGRALHEFPEPVEWDHDGSPLGGSDRG